MKFIEKLIILEELLGAYEVFYITVKGQKEITEIKTANYYAVRGLKHGKRKGK